MALQALSILWFWYFRSHWRYVISNLNEYSYEEKMLYLIMNADDTFEIRWVDYYSIRYIIRNSNINSGFDEIMNLEEGTHPPTSLSSESEP